MLNEPAAQSKVLRNDPMSRLPLELSLRIFQYIRAAEEVQRKKDSLSTLSLDANKDAAPKGRLRVFMLTCRTVSRAWLAFLSTEPAGKQVCEQQKYWDPAEPQPLSWWALARFWGNDVHVFRNNCSQKSSGKKIPKQLRYWPFGEVENEKDSVATTIHTGVGTTIQLNKVYAIPSKSEMNPKSRDADQSSKKNHGGDARENTIVLGYLARNNWVNRQFGLRRLPRKIGFFYHSATRAVYFASQHVLGCHVRDLPVDSVVLSQFLTLPLRLPGYSHFHSIGSIPPEILLSNMIILATGEICYYPSLKKTLAESAPPQPNRRQYTGYMISTIAGEHYRELMKRPNPAEGAHRCEKHGQRDVMGQLSGELLGAFMQQIMLYLGLNDSEKTQFLFNPCLETLQKFPSLSSLDADCLKYIACIRCHGYMAIRDHPCIMKNNFHESYEPNDTVTSYLRRLIQNQATSRGGYLSVGMGPKDFAVLKTSERDLLKCSMNDYSSLAVGSNGCLNDADYFTIGPPVFGSERPIDGFAYHENFLSDEESRNLEAAIESLHDLWVNDNENKRVMVFGYNYLTPNLSPVSIPQSLDWLIEKIKTQFGSFDQMIISDYSEGIGLAAHVDRLYWDNRILGLSLLSSCEMVLRNIDSSFAESYSLKPGSIYVLEGNSRYQCTHEILAGSMTQRRISITLRNLANKKVVIPSNYVHSADFM